MKNQANSNDRASHQEAIDFSRYSTISMTMLDPHDPGTRNEYPKKWRAAAVASNERFLAALGVRT